MFCCCRIEDVDEIALGRPARLSRHPQPLVKVRRSREGLKPNSASCSRLQAAGNGDGKECHAHVLQASICGPVGRIGRKVIQSDGRARFGLFRFEVKHREALEVIQCVRNVALVSATRSSTFQVNSPPIPRPVFVRGLVSPTRPQEQVLIRGGSDDAGCSFSRVPVGKVGRQWKPQPRGRVWAVGRAVNKAAGTPNNSSFQRSSPMVNRALPWPVPASSAPERAQE